MKEDYKIEAGEEGKEHRTYKVTEVEEESEIDFKKR